MTPLTAGSEARRQIGDRLGHQERKTTGLYYECCPHRSTPTGPILARSIIGPFFTAPPGVGIAHTDGTWGPGFHEMTAQLRSLARYADQVPPAKPPSNSVTVVWAASLGDNRRGYQGRGLKQAFESCILPRGDGFAHRSSSARRVRSIFTPARAPHRLRSRSSVAHQPSLADYPAAMPRTHCVSLLNEATSTALRRRTATRRTPPASITKLRSDRGHILGADVQDEPSALAAPELFPRRSSATASQGANASGALKRSFVRLLPAAPDFRNHR